MLENGVRIIQVQWIMLPVYTELRGFRKNGGWMAMLSDSDQSFRPIPCITNSSLLSIQLILVVYLHALQLYQGCGEVNIVMALWEML